MFQISARDMSTRARQRAEKTCIEEEEEKSNNKYDLFSPIYPKFTK